jgi:hypothetical protein
LSPIHSCCIARCGLRLGHHESDDGAGQWRIGEQYEPRRCWNGFERVRQLWIWIERQRKLGLWFWLWFGIRFGFWQRRIGLRVGVWWFGQFRIGIERQWKLGFWLGFGKRRFGIWRIGKCRRSAGSCSR